MLVILYKIDGIEYAVNHIDVHKVKNKCLMTFKKCLKS